MSNTQILFLSNTIYDGYDYLPSGRWDGYICPVTLSFTEGTFQGYSLNWGSFEEDEVVNSFANQSYIGYNTNWNSVNITGLALSATNQSYVGYNTNWGGIEVEFNNSQPLYDSDINSVIDHPKDQIIYFKLKGWNKLNSSYETWVVSENITSRPETFDPTPGRQPPNFERDVFKTPPSGNSLENIVIIARWFQ